jgi:hypothetical protein
MKTNVSTVAISQVQNLQMLEVPGGLKKKGLASFDSFFFSDPIFRTHSSLLPLLFRSERTNKKNDAFTNHLDNQLSTHIFTNTAP